MNALQLLLFSGLAFFLLLPIMQRTLTVTLDVDRLWRPGGGSPSVAGLAGRLLAPVLAGRSGLLVRAARAADAVLHPFRPEGILAAAPPIGTMVRNVLIALLLALVLGYLAIREASSAGFESMCTTTTNTERHSKVTLPPCKGMGSKNPSARQPILGLPSPQTPLPEGEGLYLPSV